MGIPKIVLGVLLGLFMDACWPASIEAQSQEQVSDSKPAAIALEQSSDPSAHLNYASILFYTGQKQLSRGETEAAMKTFQEVQRELEFALQLSANQPDGLGRQVLRSQAAYLLGDLHFFVFNDRDKAKMWYQESVTNFPDHAASIDALKRFE